MNNRENIEDLFKDAFTNWEPEVPGEVKIAIDEELFSDKKSIFVRFKFLFINLFVILITAAAWIFTGTNNTENQVEVVSVQAENQSNSQNSSENLEKTDVFQSSNIQIETTSENQTTNLSDDNSQTNSTNKSSESTKHQTNTKTNRTNSISPFKKKIERTNLKRRDYQKNNVNPQAEANKTANLKNIGVKDSNVQQSIKQESLTSKNQDTQKESQSETTEYQSNKSDINSPTAKNDPLVIPSETNSDSIKRIRSGQEFNDDKNKFKSAFYVGTQGGIHKGVNIIADNSATLSEKLNYAFGLDLFYQFKQNQMISSGLMYQARKELYNQMSFSVDSTFLYTDTLYQTIVIPGTNDTMTIISGYNDIYSYDTTTIIQFSNATIRLAMIPLSYDFRILAYRNQALWLRSGVHLGMYQSRITDAFGQSTNLNQMALQLQIRPTYLVTFGRWQAGLFSNFSYDAILPQTWLGSRKRWQSGFGLQLMYKF